MTELFPHQVSEPESRCSICSTECQDPDLTLFCSVCVVREKEKEEIGCTCDLGADFQSLAAAIHHLSVLLQKQEGQIISPTGFDHIDSSIAGALVHEAIHLCGHHQQ